MLSDNPQILYYKIISTSFYKLLENWNSNNEMTHSHFVKLKIILSCWLGRERNQFPLRGLQYVSIISNVICVQYYLLHFKLTTIDNDSDDSFSIPWNSLKILSSQIADWAESKNNALSVSCSIISPWRWLWSSWSSYILLQYWRRWQMTQVKLEQKFVLKYICFYYLHPPICTHWSKIK